MKEIAVFDETRTVTYHIRYREALPGEIAQGKRFVVCLPSGFDPNLRLAFVDDFGVTLAGIDFVNEQSDTIDLTFTEVAGVGRKRIKVELANEYKTKRAKTLVTQYLPSLGFDTELLGQLTGLVDQQKVGFLSKSEWKSVAKGPGGSPEETEGITTPDPRGKRLVWINEEDHTLNTIVHELFHAIASDGLQFSFQGSPPQDLVEGITEYFALQASGLNFRFPRDGSRPIYRNNVRVVRIALDKGAVTPEQLVHGYFLGNTDLWNTGLWKRLIDGWKVYTTLDEKIDFLPTGQSPTQQQIDEMWKAVETALS